MRIVQKKGFVSAQTIAGNYSSPALEVSHLIVASLEYVVTGTPTGTLKAQASIDGVVWYDLATLTAALAGAAASGLWNLSDMGYKYVRVTYVFTSGTGVLTVNVNAKGI